MRKFFQRIRIAAFFIFLFNMPIYANAATITIAPADTPGVSNCYPFGIGVNDSSSWLPFAGFIYQNVPAFDLQIGDIIAFDLGAQNDVDIELQIDMAATTTNGGNVEAVAFTAIVTNTQTPENPRGNATLGDYELRFTVETPFSFPGGGLIIRFSNPSAAYGLDTTCLNSQVLVNTTSSDSSGYFVQRFYRDTDGVSPWNVESEEYLGGFQVITSDVPVAIPTMNEWGLIVFMLLAGFASVVYIRKNAIT